MNWLWVIFALLTGLAVLAVLWPLARTPAAADPRELDVAFYKAQTAEIARDKTRGVIGVDEAEIARNEAARRLVAAAQRKAPETARGSPIAVRAVAIASLVLVPLLAIPLYEHVGAPGMPDDPLQARLDAPPTDMNLPTMIAKIEQHLAAHPDDGRGWAVLAPIYVRLGRADDAVRAYENEIRVLGATADRLGGLGEAQVDVGDGVVTAAAKASFEKAVALEPMSPRANFYLGIAAEQDGDKPKALAIWRQLEAHSAPDAPWMPTLRSHIAEASGQALPPVAAAGAPEGVSIPAGGAGMPAGAAAVAAMPKDRQLAMIHTMVDRLADRLKTNGNDIDGWLRLVRAYRVLDEQDKAKLALGDARRNFAADPTATKRLDALARELGMESS